MRQRRVSSILYTHKGCVEYWIQSTAAEASMLRHALVQSQRLSTSIWSWRSLYSEESTCRRCCRSWRARMRFPYLFTYLSAYYDYFASSCCAWGAPGTELLVSVSLYICVHILEAYLSSDYARGAPVTELLVSVPLSLCVHTMSTYQCVLKLCVKSATNRGFGSLSAL